MKDTCCLKTTLNFHIYKNVNYKEFYNIMKLYKHIYYNIQIDFFLKNEKKP